MNLLVDTSVWSLALRRDAPPKVPEVDRLTHALQTGEPVLTTGLVLQELLQGFRGPKSQDRIVSHLSLLPFLVPERSDHIEAAALRNTCRRRGLTLGTIDALLAQLCIRHELTFLTTDRDFVRVARHSPLSVWRCEA